VHNPHIVTLLVVLLARACSPIPILNMLAPADGIAITQNVSYGEGPRRTLDVYAPPQTARSAPVLVFFYGGAWRIGMKQWHRYIGVSLAEHGVLVVIPDYRQYPEVTFPAFMDDAAAAVAWSRANAARFGGDPRRLFIMGHSAGGQIAALLALDPSYLRSAGLPDGSVCGVIGLAGAYDLHPANPADFPAIPADAWAQSRPINHVTPHAPPMLLLTGDADKVVEPGNTLRLAARLRAADMPVSVAVYPAIDHMALMEALAGPLAFLAPVRDASLRFIADGGSCGH
jgi:acetyl esterase/lipase